MYSYRYFASEHRMLIRIGKIGYNLSMIGPATTEFLRQLVDTANRSKPANEADSPIPSGNGYSAYPRHRAESIQDGD